MAPTLSTSPIKSTMAWQASRSRATLAPARRASRRASGSKCNRPSLFLRRGRLFSPIERRGDSHRFEMSQMGFDQLRVTPWDLKPPHVLTHRNDWVYHAAEPFRCKYGWQPGNLRSDLFGDYGE